MMIDNVAFDPPDIGAFRFEAVVFEAYFVPHLIQKLLFPGLHGLLR